MAPPGPHCEVTGGETKRKSRPGVLLFLESNMEHLGFVDSVFIGEHKTEGQGLQYGKGNVSGQVISYLG